MYLEKDILNRGIVLMVAHRSPKPPVRVRVLLPLPFKIKYITMKKKKCYKFYFREQVRS